MITIKIDDLSGPEVAQVVTDGPQAFSGTIPTRTLAENLLTHVAGVRGAQVDGWINLLDTPANTALKVQGSGKITCVTYFPPREVEMKMLQPLVTNRGSGRTFTDEEVCVRPVALPGSVWTGTWNAARALIHTGFMLCAEPPNPADFLNTPLRSFDYGNVYEHGRLCWGSNSPTAPVGNLWFLDRFFFEGSVNNFDLQRSPEGERWYLQVFFGLSPTEWERLMNAFPAPTTRDEVRLPWAQVLERNLLPNLPTVSAIPLGAYRSTISRLIEGSGGA